MNDEPIPVGSGPVVGTRVVAGTLVAAYFIAIAIVASTGPLGVTGLTVVALVPGAVVAGFGIPRVLGSGPRGLMAIFHLVVYPIVAIVAVGLPGVLVAARLAEAFGP